MQEITKAKLLYQIDHLIEYLNLDQSDCDDAIHKVIKSELSWADNEKLEEYYYWGQDKYYRDNWEDFLDAYYWEFCVED